MLGVSLIEKKNLIKILRTRTNLVNKSGSNDKNKIDKRKDHLSQPFRHSSLITFSRKNRDVM